jgi:hypothetical protein
MNGLAVNLYEYIRGHYVASDKSGVYERKTWRQIQ